MVQSRGGLRNALIPALVVIVVVLTILTVNTSRAEQEEFDRDIEAAVDLVAQRVDARLQRGVLEAEALRGLFAASEEVEADEFAAYTSLLFDSETLEGVTALGWSPRVLREDIPALEATVRTDTSINPDGNPTFEVFPPVTDVDADPVVYVAPNSNSAAWGFNLASNPSRRAALDAARDTGEVISTEPLVLVQEEADSAAVILYAAVYEGGRTPATVAERQAAYRGSVSVVLRSVEFIAPVIADPRIEVTLYDVTTADVAESAAQSQSAAADLTPQGVAPAAMLLPAFDPAGRTAIERVVDAPGREWMLVASAVEPRPAAVDAGILMPRLLPLLAVVGLFLILGRSERRALDEAQVAAEEVRASEQRLGALVASSPDGLLLLDAEGAVQFASNEADRLLSYHGQPVVDTNIEALLSSGRGPVLDRLRDMTDGRVEFEGRSPSGTGIDVTAVAFDDDQILVSVRDATARIRAFDLMERAVVRERQAAERERELAASRRALLSTVSHELKTPLTAILGFSSLLNQQTKDDNPVVGQAANRIVRNAKTLVSLVDDLVAFSRLERDDFVLDLADVDACALVEDIVESMRPVLDQHQLTVSGQSVTAALDPTAVTRIMSNLLINAARYTPPGTHVEVAVVPDRDGVRISVDDSGPGVPADERQLIFERYQRGSGGAAATSVGTGVGLWVVRELAHRMGGDVVLEDSQLGGARFVVRLASTHAGMSTDAPDGQPGTVPV
ncbi:CHASE domain-containing protein [Euzebya tangerina]|uniref:CHASE domain-containing sensor histidine kinase n=1 Tax=Euzebya tangerina TaxID=591198 RepID=UPI0013C37B6F|nr:CHASE domain-containing protein [Euzebya tangerina]